MSRKGRRLRPEEQDLWQQIARTATPLNPASKSPEPLLAKKSKEGVQQKTSVPQFRVGERALAQPTETRIVAPDHPIQMDRKTYGRMKRGKQAPEARIDLHGMTVDVAHSALRAFLLRTHAEGKRLALVITGKGSGDQPMGFADSSRGVLRRQVPHWLEQPPLRQIVLQTAPAHQRHGGSGALYVYLRR